MIVVLVITQLIYFYFVTYNDIIEAQLTQVKYV